MLIKNLLVGLQADPLVAPTAWEAVRFVSWKSDTKDDTEPVEEFNATHVKEQDATESAGHQESELGVEMYFDQFGIWLTMLNGAPITTNDPGGATGTKQHAWKRGIATPKAAAFRWFDGVTWRESIGNVLNTMDLAQAAEKRLKLTLKFLGVPESEISAPTVPAFAYAAYNHPLKSTQQVFKVAGAATPILQSSKWTFGNNRKPHFGTRASAAPTRFDMGAMTQHADLMADFDAYTGSFYQKFKSGTAVGAVELLLQDMGTTIGAGTPTNPSVSLLFPNPKQRVAKRDFQKDFVEQTATIFGRYDAATASYFTATLVNEKPATYYAGT